LWLCRNVWFYLRTCYPIWQIACSWISLWPLQVPYLISYFQVRVILEFQSLILVSLFLPFIIIKALIRPIPSIFLCVVLFIQISKFKYGKQCKKNTILLILLSFYYIFTYFIFAQFLKGHTIYDNTGFSFIFYFSTCLNYYNTYH